MGQIQTHRPVMLIAAVTSRYVEAIDQWARSQMIGRWGSLLFESPLFDFTETSFYTKSMGTELKKKLFAFEELIDPAEIAAAKITSNQLELDYLASTQHEEQRPINIDPGYISEAKLVLATTKDRDHRIYLQQGIYAEVTLHLHQGSWRKERWTYPDYQREDFQMFFSQCRAKLREIYRTPR